jgi:hypothetical protein
MTLSRRSLNKLRLAPYLSFIFFSLLLPAFFYLLLFFSFITSLLQWLLLVYHTL